MQLAWQHQSLTEHNFELREYMRGERRRGRKGLAIPVEKRGKLLLQAGFSLAEIGAAALEVEITKKLRSDTLKYQKWDRANIILETTKSLPRGVVNGLGSLVIKPKQRTVHARSA